MGGGWSALSDSEMKDKRSYAEAVREPGLQQQARRRAQRHRTNDDGTGGSSETGTVAPEPARSLPAKNGQRKTLLLQARARTARMEEELETIKVRLVHEQHQRENDLRRADVLLKGKQQELKDLQASHDRLEAIVQDRNAARLLAGGVNIQAACPTLLEIEAHIRRALTVNASEWVEEALPRLPAVVPLARVLSQAFSGSQDQVNSIVHGHVLFMNGGNENEHGASMLKYRASTV